jgi:acyl-CoA synthetase (AMP-forming)/AMP-acid ligase II
MSPELSPDELRRTFDPQALGVKTTEQLSALDGRIIGQERAVRALQFGLHISSTGFNTYVAGPPGIGKMTAIQTFLEELARRTETPPDWCYVNNFEDPYQPMALRLPPGTARRLQQELKALVEHLHREIPKAFVVARGEVTAEELMEFVAERVAGYKKIREIEFVEAIPKSPSGKILKKELLERERSRSKGPD